MNLQYRPCSEEERGCSFSTIFLLMAFLSTLVSDGSFPMTQAGEIPGLFLLKSDVNLFNHG